MALVHKRRLPSLTLDLPSSSSPAAAATRFPLPPPASYPAAVRLADLDRIAVLGAGNDGTVYKAVHRRTGAVYALKILSGESASAREAEILLRTRDCPHILTLHAVISGGADSALVLELMPGGSLASLLHRRLGRPLPELPLAAVARQALLGLSYLHSHKIVHRDLKPSNLLLGLAGEVKIADFGVGKILRRRLDTCASYVGTAAYMSPERFDPERYGGDYDAYAGDIWSLGLAVLELYLGHFPLLPQGQRPDWAALMCAICFREAPSPPESASPEFKDFVASCLQKEAGKRPSIAELLAHPFVAEKDPAEAKKSLAELVALAAAGGGDEEVREHR